MVADCMKKDKIYLDSVSIQGFRGFDDEMCIKLDTPITLLFGINGGGKTSTLESIEWCLFGNTSDIVFKRTDNELINALVREINVALTLDFDGRRIDINRIKKRNKKPTLNVTGLGTNDSDYALFQFLGLTFSDFIRAVFLHQESLQSVADENADRDRAIDRLFGLEMLSNILEALPISDIRSKERDMIAKLDELKNQLAGNIQEAQNRERGNIRKCRQCGIEENLITFEFAKNIFLNTNKTVSELATEVNLEKLPDVIPNSVEQLEDYMVNIGNKIKRTREKFIPKDVDKINSSISILTRLRSDYSVFVSRERDRKQELTDLTKKYGTASSLNTQIGDIDARIGKLNDKKLSLDARHEVIKDSFEYLKIMKINSCPVCNRDFSKSLSQENVLERLKKELDNSENEEIDEMDKNIEKLTKQQKELRRQIKQIETKNEEFEDARKELRDFISEKISKELLRTLKLSDDIDKILETKLGELDRKAKQFQTSFTEKNKKLEYLEEELHKILLVCDVLNDRTRIEKIAEIEQSEEFGQMEHKIQTLGNLKSDLEALSVYVSEIQVNLADIMLKESLPLIKQYYKKLCNHPFYSDIRIDHESQKRSGKLCNKYTITCFNPDNDETTVANQNLSTAQINSVALSIYLALAKIGTMKNNIGFLIMDDPTQNLDLEHKNRYVPYFKMLRKKNSF